VFRPPPVTIVPPAPRPTRRGLVRGVQLSVQTPPTVPAGRYGNDSRRGRLVAYVVLAVVAVAGIGWLGWAALSAADKDVHARVLSYDAASPRGVVARVEIDKPRDREAVCRLRALDRSFATVGRVDAVAPAGAARRVVEVTVPTSAQALNAELVRCSLR